MPWVPQSLGVTSPYLYFPILTRRSPTSSDGPALRLHLTQVGEQGQLALTLAKPVFPPTPTELQQGQ
jgi:hypothetical protein